MEKKELSMAAGQLLNLLKVEEELRAVFRVPGAAQ